MTVGLSDGKTFEDEFAYQNSFDERFKGTPIEDTQTPPPLDRSGGGLLPYKGDKLHERPLLERAKDPNDLLYNPGNIRSPIAPGRENALYRRTELDSQPFMEDLGLDPDKLAQASPTEYTNALGAHADWSKFNPIPSTNIEDHRNINNLPWWQQPERLDNALVHQILRFADEKVPITADDPEERAMQYRKGLHELYKEIDDNPPKFGHPLYRQLHDFLKSHIAMMWEDPEHINPFSTGPTSQAEKLMGASRGSGIGPRYGSKARESTKPANENEELIERTDKLLERLKNTPEDKRRLYRYERQDLEKRSDELTKRLQNDPYTKAMDASIDKQWADMVKKSNQPDLKVVKEPPSDSFTLQKGMDKIFSKEEIETMKGTARKEYEKAVETPKTSDEQKFEAAVKKQFEQKKKTKLDLVPKE